MNGPNCSLSRASRLLLGLLICCATTAAASELKQGTLDAWKLYERLTEQRIASELSSGEGFLVQDSFSPEERAKCKREVEAGRVCIQPMRTLGSDGKEIDVPKGLIHHWLGAIRVPNADLDELVAWVQDYDQHEKFFDEVQQSRITSRDGEAFQISMRLMRKKIVTVHYEAEFDILYSRHGPGRVSSLGRSTRIVQLEDAGTPNEREQSPGQDSGYLWRLNSYWRFMTDGDGVVVSCETISLSRALPPLVGGLIKGFVNSVPRESLERTLTSVRSGFARSRRSAPKAQEGAAGEK